MKRIGLGTSLLAAILPAMAARAADQPLYQPAPGWVVAASLPPALLAPGGNPPAALDFQERLSQGQVWDYLDIATRIASSEQLAQNAMLTLPWFPDKGDLIIHELSILRGGETIDLLAQGQKFSVLRREQNLEQQELTGMLTATLAVEGLRVGDTLRLRASGTRRDRALAGHVQWVSPLLALPTRTSKASMRVLWPAGEAMHWKLLAGNGVATIATVGGERVLNVALPVPKAPDMPEDAPARFRHPPLIEVSSFGSWADVSQTAAALYKTQGAIAPDSALAKAVAQIAAQTTDPTQRIASALRLVQEDVRYLALAMDGGNYTPQPAEKTWAVRYGDCKAKTLLLLAMLDALHIEAEPVLANVGLDDLVQERLPSLAAFNHILVRARVDGRSIWLDGTQTGTRLADLHDTPSLRYVLPVRPGGAALEEVERQAPARALADLDLLVDESSSIDLPSVIDARVTLRGQQATQLSLMAGQLGDKEKRELLDSVLSNMVGQGQFTSLALSEDRQEASVTVTGRGLLTPIWKEEDKRHKRSLSRVLDKLAFAPDRARAAWADIPVATASPDKIHIHTRLLLPDGGRGYTLEGAPAFSGEVAGFMLTRQATLAGGTLSFEESLSSRAAEIAPARIPAERALAAQAVSAAPRLLAPADALRRWNLPLGAKAPGTQLAAVSALFNAAVAAAEPDDTAALEGQVSFLKGIGDYPAALASASKIIAREPSVQNYLRRADLEMQTGAVAAAAADVQAARALDPSNVAALAHGAQIAARRGDVAGAVAMLDERIALGGKEQDGLRLTKATLIATYGDVHEGLAQLDALIAQRPGRPDLLNARCWAKGLRQAEIDTALQDCTSAIELTNHSGPILDSRAVVWLRLGRLDAAMNDLDAALLQNPSQGPTHLVRAIVLKKLGRMADAQRELASARRLDPDTEAEYRRFGLVY